MRTICILFLLFSSALPAEESEFGKIDDETREQYLRKAQVWRKTDAVDIVRGPERGAILATSEPVNCEYIEPKEKLTGAVPKFLCKLDNGETVRVKFGKDSRELYGEIVASRLLWALGFYADEVFPVKLLCRNCPKNPAEPEAGADRGDHLIEDAAIEFNFSGITIEEKEDQGWTWKEFDALTGREGAPRAHLDAFRLLAVFLQHADSKPDNQRLACFPEDVEKNSAGKATCKRPVAMIQDLGSTFGSGTDLIHVSKMSLSDWKSQPIWDVKAEAEYRLRYKKPVCVGHLSASKLAGPEGLNNPLISEDGRKFLADLLNGLSDQQILDLFRIARVERKGEKLSSDNGEKTVTAEDWAAVFKAKRREINEKRCSLIAKS